MSTNTNTNTNTRPVWDTAETTSVVPSSTEAVEAALTDIEMGAGSSGWICTLTIECGTVICACR